MRMTSEQLVELVTPRAREALIRGIIWAFVGVLYAILFASFAVFAEKWSIPVNPYFFAAIMAGSLGALMYSSMRLVVFIAFLLFPICILYFFNIETEVSFVDLLKISVPSGLVIGALYGQFSKRSRVKHADAKTLAGLSAGFLVALGYLTIQAFFEDPPIAWVVGLMTPISGALYVTLVPLFIRLYSDLLPPVADGALVGASVAVFISLSLLLMQGSIDAYGVIPEVLDILELLPMAALGGVLGAGSAGVISGLLLTNWQDL